MYVQNLGKKLVMAQKPSELANTTGSPIAGVLCVDIASEIGATYGKHLHSYIAASYVQFLECAGARVVPVWIGRPREYYEQLMNKLNGILLPGGAVFISSEESAGTAPNPLLTNECVISAKHIYDIATEKNEAGEYFPIWGTCLGFQLLFIHAMNSENVRQPCTALVRAMRLQLSQGEYLAQTDESCHLNIDPVAPIAINYSLDYRDSYMFKSLNGALEEHLGMEAFAIHNHRYCITPASAAHADWHVLATNKDNNGLEFITLVEHRKYPYFGSQFHPERVAHEQLTPPENKAISARCCVELAQYFSHVFVDACRRSTNRFESSAEEQRHLIWNFMPTFTGRHEQLRWRVCYLFTRDTDYPSA